MADMTASIVYADVRHKRLIPKENGFSYGFYYVVLPLERIEDGSLESILAMNRFAFHSFFLSDHGYRNGDSLRQWVEDALSFYHLPKPHRIALMCMPRLLGYVFNPVSFWLCYNEAGEIYAVICEVNNTFGETHSYVCAHDNGSVIGSNDMLQAKKCFHVSPFLAVEGVYHFRFNIKEDRCVIRIDLRDEAGQGILFTSIHGHFAPLSKRALNRAFLRYPFMTLKAIGLIHYQALRLLCKKIRHFSKPEQRKKRLSRSDHNASRKGKNPE